MPSDTGETKQEPTYLSQGIDYLGFLNAKLRDLRGWGTLANELIQNADDAEGATQIVFDVRDDGLVVENDGRFTDCGVVEAGECPDERSCDFHAFRSVAGGHKREVEDTTGAFGIGFIAVYQVTDRPVLQSGRHRWEICPGATEDRRIRATRLATAHSGTRFELPWALEDSELRRRLAVERVPVDVVNRMSHDLRQALPEAAPFLRRLKLLELRVEGRTELAVTCDRDDTTTDLLVLVGGEGQIWRRLTGDFSEEAAGLRSRYGERIEAKRRPSVTVAVPVEGLPELGRFYAGLPTHHTFPLPVLINGDLYPSSDRKRLLLDQDYQGEWNRAAVEAAARALAKNLAGLRDVLRPGDLWLLIERAWGSRADGSGADTEAALGAFWAEMERVVRSSDLVLTTTGAWASVPDVRLLRHWRAEHGALPSLEGLGLEVVDESLARYATVLRACGVAELCIVDITQRLVHLGLDQAVPVSEAPRWLQDASQRALLGDEIAALLQRVAKADGATACERLKECSLCCTTAGRLVPLRDARRADAQTQALFDPLGSIDWAAVGEAPALETLVAEYTAADAVTVLQGAGSTLSEVYGGDATWPAKIVRWLEGRQSEWVAQRDLRDAVSALPIWPSGGRLYPLAELAVPGDFADPLGLAQILDSSVSDVCGPFLVEHLDARWLDLETYLLEHVPRVFKAESTPSQELRRALLGLVVDHIGVLLDRADIASELGCVEIVECTDGKFRKASECYLPERNVLAVLGESAPTALLPPETPAAYHGTLEWLGVSSCPRASDVLTRIEGLTANPPTVISRQVAQEVFQGLSTGWEDYPEQAGLEALRNWAWLPASGSDQWHKPSEVNSVFRAHLFNTQAKFTDLPQPTQQKGTEFLEYLGVKSEPRVEQVVAHLKAMSERGDLVNEEVYAFLDHNSGESCVRQLCGTPCLWLAGRYVCPDKAYLGTHPFGRFRYRLASQWGRYQSLLDLLGVVAQPRAKDALGVLQDVASDYSDRRPLGDDDYAVVMACWELLDLAPGEESGVGSGALRAQALVPNMRRILYPPEWVFFEDRPRLAERFGSLLADNVIPRPERGGKGMLDAGVRRLSEAIDTTLLECEDYRPDLDRTARLRSRHSLIRRILVPLSPERGPTTPEDLPEVWAASSLRLGYTVRLNGQSHEGTPEDVPAYLSPADGRLYVAAQHGSDAAAVARELAFAFCPDGRAGHVAAALKEVLAPDSEEQAARNLDDLGVPPVNVVTPEPEEPAPVAVPPPSPGGSDALAEMPAEVASAEADAGGSEDNVSPDGAAAADGEIADTVTCAATPAAARGPRGGTGSSPTVPRRTRRERGKLRSYVYREEIANGRHQSPEQVQERERIDAAGMRRAMSYERAQGRIPTEEDHTNPGFDITSRDSEGAVVRFIEVKATAGPWDGLGVGLSARQYECAREKGAQYWLYVVERAGAEEEELLSLQDPASQVGEYRFDDGWRSAVNDQDPTRRRSLRDLPGYPSPQPAGPAMAIPGREDDTQ